MSVYGITWKRKIFTYGQHVLTKILFPNFTVRDPNGSFVAKASTIKPMISSITAKNYFFTTSLAIHAYYKHLNLTEVPVIYTQLNEGSTVNILNYCVSFVRQILSLFVTLKLR